MYADKHNPKQTCTMLRSKTIFISHGSKPGILSNTLSNYATILVPKEKKKKKTHAQPKYIIQQYAQNALLF